MGTKDQILEKYNDKIAAIVTNWGYPLGMTSERKILEVKEWLCNFDSDEIPVMFELLPFIDLKTEHEKDDCLKRIAQIILSTFSACVNKVYFFDLGGNPSSSGSQFLYTLKSKLRLPKNNFPGNNGNYNSFEKSAEAFVFIDDLVGSGNQAVEFYKSHLKELTVPCYYYCLWGYESGVQNIISNTKFKVVCPASPIKGSSRVFSSQFDLPHKDEIQAIAEKYGKKLYPDHPLGYDDSQALICYTYGCPNNTLPIIWASDKNEKEKGIAWKPLFEREKTVKARQAPKVTKYTVSRDLVFDFYTSLNREKYEDAYGCLSSDLKRRRYKDGNDDSDDGFERFRKGYSNTLRIFPPQIFRVVQQESYDRHIVWYHEEIKTLKFGEMGNLGKQKLGHFGEIESQIFYFKRFLIDQVGVPLHKVDQVPLHLFFSANVVEDVCWHCGYSYDEVERYFKSEPDKIVRVKYVDCSMADGSWYIDEFLFVNHSSDPTI